MTVYFQTARFLIPRRAQNIWSGADANETSTSTSRPLFLGIKVGAMLPFELGDAG